MELAYKNFGYEIADSLLGSALNPIISAYWEEYDKDEPNQKLLAFLKAKQKAIDDFRESIDPFDPKDEELIKAILDPKNAQIFRNP